MKGQANYMTVAKPSQQVGGASAIPIHRAVRQEIETAPSRWFNLLSTLDTLNMTAYASQFLKNNRTIGAGPLLHQKYHMTFLVAFASAASFSRVISC